MGQVLQFIQNISYLDLGEGEMERLGRVAVEGAWQLTGVGLARWKAIQVDLSVVTVFPSLSAVGSWEEELLFLWTLQCPRTFRSLCCRMHISV